MLECVDLPKKMNETCWFRISRRIFGSQRTPISTPDTKKQSLLTELQEGGVTELQEGGDALLSVVAVTVQ